MYKLLLVSDKEEIRTLYRGYSEWENLGFEQPTIAENAQKGLRVTISLPLLPLLKESIGKDA